MKPGHEQRFVATTAGLRWGTRDMQGELRRLDDWLACVAAGCSAAPLKHEGLQAGHALATQAADIDRLLAEKARDWLLQRDDLAPAQALADALDGKAIFLVFGKFNAGKSSLCNYLGERFAALGHEARFFRIEAGRVVTVPERLMEGATETTTALQGLCLGHRLVLLDTPGLHSVRPENAALTQRFTDAADGVLWLTGSTSPGQVQELEDLARELRRGKPLLPVITRSDYLEEDEIEGEIRKVLRNKSPATRQLQQDDVQARGREKLGLMGVDAGLLKSPVSVSVHAARKLGIAREAGLDAFWAAFLDVVEPALAYKGRKNAELVIHHGEECVLHDLSEIIRPQLNIFLAGLAAEQSMLELREHELGRKVWRAVVPDIATHMEQWANSGELGTLAGNLVQHAFIIEAGRTLAGYKFDPGAPVSLTLDKSFPSHQQMNAALEDALIEALRQAAARVIRECSRSLAVLAARAETLAETFGEYEAKFAVIRNSVRAVEPNTSLIIKQE